uniref:Uncharacterized protein n=1 Tax=Anguilla anguilla TaxID=7936 RepID=A0A0E9SEW7_ANGAN
MGLECSELNILMLMSQSLLEIESKRVPEH